MDEPALSGSLLSTFWSVFGSLPTVSERAAVSSHKVGGFLLVVSWINSQTVWSVKTLIVKVSKKDKNLCIFKSTEGIVVWVEMRRTLLPKSWFGSLLTLSRSIWVFYMQEYRIALLFAQCCCWFTKLCLINKAIWWFCSLQCSAEGFRVSGIEALRFCLRWSSSCWKITTIVSAC